MCGVCGAVCVCDVWGGVRFVCVVTVCICRVCVVCVLYVLWGVSMAASSAVLLCLAPPSGEALHKSLKTLKTGKSLLGSGDTHL